jgi:bifunctional UDP-N-acetylglucosamine pyrophosphorylase/glucosamine-1-phosphate N-acetyltransferase
VDTVCAFFLPSSASSFIAENDSEVAGVNDKVQLAELERVLQQNQAHQFMQQGLMLKDPAHPCTHHGIAHIT